MERDARKMRGDGPFIFTQVKNGVGVEEVISHVTGAWKKQTGA
jgi:urease accessory protein